MNDCHGEPGAVLPQVMRALVPTLSLAGGEEGKDATNALDGAADFVAAACETQIRQVGISPLSPLDLP